MAADKNSSVLPEGYRGRHDLALGAAARWQQARLTRQLYWAEVDAAQANNRQPVHSVSGATAEAAIKEMKDAMAWLEVYPPELDRWRPERHGCCGRYPGFAGGRTRKRLV